MFCALFTPSKLGYITGFVTGRNYRLNKIILEDKIVKLYYWHKTYCITWYSHFLGCIIIISPNIKLVTGTKCDTSFLKVLKCQI